MSKMCDVMGGWGGGGGGGGGEFNNVTIMDKSGLEMPEVTFHYTVVYYEHGYMLECGCILNCFSYAIISSLYLVSLISVAVQTL